MENYEDQTHPDLIGGLESIRQEAELQQLLIDERVKTDLEKLRGVVTQVLDAGSDETFDPGAVVGVMYGMLPRIIDRVDKSTLGQSSHPVMPAGYCDQPVFLDALLAASKSVGTSVTAIYNAT